MSKKPKKTQEKLEEKSAKVEEEEQLVPVKKLNKEEQEMLDVKKEISKEDKEEKSEGSGYNAFLAVVAIAVVAALGMYYLLTSLGGVSSIVEVEEEILTVIYSKELRSDSTEGRSFPTLQILKRVGDEAPVVLVEEIGGVGEYPNFFRLGPDNKKLYGSLESKLVVIDLEEGGYEEIFTPNKQVMDIDFYDDGKMIIWDQIYASQDFEYFVHEYDLASAEVKVLQSGNTEDKYLFLGGKNGNTLLLNQAMGEASSPWTMDLANGELQKVADPALFVSFSRTGKYLTIPDQDVVDICNDFMGSSVSSFAVANVSDAEHILSFGKDGLALSNFWLKADDSEIVYATQPVMKEREGEEYEDRTNRCAVFNPKRTFYKQSLSAGSEPELVKNPDDIYEEWNPGKLRITGGKDDTGLTWVYFYRGKVIFDPIGKYLISVYK
ncbi:hypothetical protein JKY72_00950 [Candidatus Gracilibacteria bacterium]|nr:hypothetical protein [Candidatus Gracilibacteria bacterium]